MMSNHSINGEDNDLVLSQVINLQFKKQMAKKYPSAEDLIDQVPLRKVIFK